MSLALALPLLLLGAAPVKVPEITAGSQLKDAMGQEVALVGVLERVELQKGKGAWQGTAVVLDDDTAVYVTYGAPPKQWEALVGETVRVEGRLSPSLDDHGQSLLAPHLRNPGAARKVERKLNELKTHRVRLAGVARDAKGGAVLLLGNTPVYLAGLESWPSEAQGQRVAVGGTLQNEAFLPEATVDKKGAISQGAKGTQWVLRTPTWRVVKEPKP